MLKNASQSKVLRTVLSLVLVALYAVGLIFIITGSLQVGAILWVISTVGGIGLLYWIRTVDGDKSEGKPKADASEDDTENEA